LTTKKKQKKKTIRNSKYNGTFCSKSNTKHNQIGELNPKSLQTQIYTIHTHTSIHECAVTGSVSGSAYMYTLSYI